MKKPRKLSQDPEKVKARVAKLALRMRPLFRLPNGTLREIDLEQVDVMKTDITCRPEIKWKVGEVKGLKVVDCVRTYHAIRSSPNFFQPTIAQTLWSARRDAPRAFKKAKYFEVLTSRVQNTGENTHEAITVLYR